MAVAHVAASLDYILWLDFKRSRIVNLLEVSGEVALVVVLPLDEATDLVGELRVADVASSLVHGALVASLERGHLHIVIETAALIAGLVLRFAADDVQDEGIAWNLLV